MGCWGSSIHVFGGVGFDLPIWLCIYFGEAVCLFVASTSYVELINFVIRLTAVGVVTVLIIGVDHDHSKGCHQSRIDPLMHIKWAVKFAR